MKFEPEDPRITAYLFDELEADEKFEFEKRLHESTVLQQLVHQTRATIESLQAEFDSRERHQLSDKQRAIVQSCLSVDSAINSVSQASALTPRKRRSVSFRRSRWFSIGGLCAVAAMLLIAACLLLPATNNARKSARFVAALKEVERTTEPFPDDGPLIYPDGKRWTELAERVKSKRGHSLSSDAAPQADFDSLTELIRTTTEPETWEIGGGRAVAPTTDLSLVVSQTQEVHEESKLGPSYREPVPVERVPDTPDHGAGPGNGGDKYDLIVENDFLRVTDAPLSTFSIDVDTASYSKIRMYLNEHQQLPRPDAVRIEELINYFPYGYEAPTNDQPFAAHQAVVTCPWNSKHRLVRIGIKGKEIRQDSRPASNLVFLLDVSGSMDEPNKLPLLKRGMKMLADQLSENDRVAIVVYAGAAGMVLDSTAGDQKAVIVEALDRLNAGGSTNGGAGIQLAYQTALDHFISGGVNRVVLCTDGDFNVGTTGTDELVRIIEQHARSGVFLSVLGFGMGNHNDSMLEQISNKGNGNYAFVDTENEARKVLVEQMSATLVTIAKDVKIQVEFNPAEVTAYRLIGYENRLLASQDFNDDTKDAGEIGAGHTVTALYEIVPSGQTAGAAPAVDELKYQIRTGLTETAGRGELLTLKIRYKDPDGNASKLLTFPLEDSRKEFHDADRDFQFAAAVASFGMLLRNSKYKGDATFDSVLEIATAAAKDDGSGYRQEFLQLVHKAARFIGESTNGAAD